MWALIITKKEEIFLLDLIIQNMVWFGLVVNGSDDDQLLLRFKSIQKGTQSSVQR